jgi:UDP-GlcNAc:undecaprenyl-phosphate GlcNAc-1-phosphate transferase
MFLFYNFNPATIFMGDTGSMFLGFVLATTAIQTNQKSSTAVALIVPVIALGVPIADTLLAMARRAARGAPLFSADRGHIHHRLLALGLSQRQAVAVLYVACAALGGLALAMSFATAGQAAWFLVGLTVVATVALWKLGYFRLEGAGQALVARRRNIMLRGGVRKVSSILRGARSHTDIHRALRLGAKVVGATDAMLEAGGTTSAVKVFGEGQAEGLDKLRAQFSITGERLGAKHLILTWDDGRSEVDRDIEIAVEVMCEHLSAALDRVPAVESSVQKGMPMPRTGAA